MWLKSGVDEPSFIIITVPQCPLEAIVASFNNYTIILAHNNDTTHPYHLNQGSVDVLCDRGYTTPNGYRLQTYECRYQGDVMGWYDMYNNSLADNVTHCTEGEYDQI